jgi:hypothetical protein
VELQFKNSFFRDFDSFGSKEPSRAIEGLIQCIKEAQTFND